MVLPYPVEPSHLLHGLGLTLSGIRSYHGIGFLYFACDGTIPHIFKIIDGDAKCQAAELFIQLLQFTAQLPEEHGAFCTVSMLSLPPFLMTLFNIR